MGNSSLLDRRQFLLEMTIQDYPVTFAELEPLMSHTQNPRHPYPADLEAF
jgi:hypothetical protein